VVRVATASVGADDLVVAVRTADGIKVYPHDILDWHEIVNDTRDDLMGPFVLSYCPLTGSAVAWRTDPAASNATFGVSGLLYNSNLILYDRETESFWAQMMEIAVNGARTREEATRIQVLESNRATVQSMFPDAMILSRDTGFIRDYDDYPYGSYRRDPGLLFPVENQDSRLHSKTRVLGVNVGNEVMAYQLDGFGDSTLVLQEQVGGQSVVIVGNSVDNFAVAFNRELGDGTILNFTAHAGSDPAHVLADGEGNVWDVWGRAVSGPRAGTALTPVRSFIAFWFAWVAFYPQAEFYFNPG
jgi:hypothetical protein